MKHIKRPIGSTIDTPKLHKRSKLLKLVVKKIEIFTKKTFRLFKAIFGFIFLISCYPIKKIKSNSFFNLFRVDEKGEIII